MQFRDLLLAIPGLISPIASQARPEEEVKLSRLTQTAIAAASPAALAAADQIQPLEASLAQRVHSPQAFWSDVPPAPTEAKETARAASDEQMLLRTAALQLSQDIPGLMSNPMSAPPSIKQARMELAESASAASADIDDASDLLAAWASGKGSGLSFASETITTPSAPASVGITGQSEALTGRDLQDSVSQALEHLPDDFKLAAVTEPKPEPETLTPVEPGGDTSTDPDNGGETPVVTPPTDNETETGSGNGDIDPPVTTPETPVPTDPETGEQGGGTDPGGDGTAETATELPARDEALTAEAGRVAIITPEDAGDIASIRILTQGEHGHVSVNPDNSLALVFSEDPGDADAVSFSYEITYADGSTRAVNTEVALTASQQKAGWSLGDTYMLETDADDRLVIEHGDNHRKVYITGSESGLTAADIAKAEGIGADKITAAWLEAHPEYGGSEDMALAPDLGVKLWYGLTHMSKGPTSNWLLLERGYQYDDLGRLVHRGSEGESALHPVVIEAYGTGAAPIVTDTLKVYQYDSKHVVIRDLNIDGGFMALQGANLLLDNLRATGKEFNIQNVDRITVRNSEVMDISHDAPVNGSDYWSPHLNRTGGLYMAKSGGVLMEGNFFDKNGWREGYDYNLAGDKPMPPSMYSHNIYMDYNNLDVTFRDNITMRGASFGAQIRSGGFIEDNAFIDNNAAVNFLGGNYRDAGPIGHFTLFMDNLITSAGHKRVAAHQGALSMGIEDRARQSSLIGNIIAHLADPNNATEQAEKHVTHNPYLRGTDTYYDDTIIYNWMSREAASKSPTTNTGIQGLDGAALNQATIQKFAAQLLGKDTATIGDLADYLRDQADGKLDSVVDADVINQFFQTAFLLIGAEQVAAAQETTARFIPDDRGEGMRWDNKLNWSTGEVPDAGTIDLGGNRVLYSAKTTDVDDFVFGNFGQFKVSSGRINIDGDISVGDKGGLLQITNAGQVWIAGYRDADLLKIHADGGRFANTGAFVGKTELKIGGDAQALLATAGNSFDLKRNSMLTVESSKAKVGFDGDDGAVAVLRMHDGSTTQFVAEADGLGQIREFRSGAFGESTDVTSGVVLNGTLRINLTAWTESKAAANVVLIDADQLLGNFDDIKIAGLGQNRDALLRINYTNDSVILVLGEAGKGSGNIRTSTTGDADFIDYSNDGALQDLWDALHSDSAPVINNPSQDLGLTE
ncbi:right-handed parallel beta-helix repeat-containing protein [Paracoccus sp. 11-3]|uniref:Right-handed parallel beta-helix repeat-containing protein n=1 Tax=Paracoccus amoyensis TaxID=2760093 RepID=A0A926JCS9_9RHOB|nr:right-handed parallel beta-helix repeat-containing protein [Paracoccus amoyensis]MBC9248501.1 right-handed parallel beta-helix repeat-containing protein [Paracoccus amoyensis]